MLPPDLGYLWLPLAACLILTGIHCYLGIHVIERQVIFVDLALAQIAALGATVALLAGHDLNSQVAYFTALGFAFVGAAVFAFTRVRHEKVPQEAIIGIVYAVASAAAIVAVSAAKDPHGAEHIKDLLAGNIILVKRAEVWKTLGIYSLVAVFHLVFRRKLIVITSSVQLAGVLLVFAYLIVPAVIAALVVESIGSRLLVGWLVGGLVSFVGLLLSYSLPAGPVLVCLFGLVLACCGVAKYVVSAQRRLVALGQVAALVALCALTISLLVHAGKGPERHDEEHQADEHQRKELSITEKKQLTAEVDIETMTAEQLATQWPRTTDERLRLQIALRLVSLGRKSGLDHLVLLMREARTPRTRIKALAVMRPLAGSDRGYDILEPTNEAIGSWESWWGANRGRVRWQATLRQFQLAPR